MGFFRGELEFCHVTLELLLVMHSDPTSTVVPHIRNYVYQYPWAYDLLVQANEISQTDLSKAQKLCAEIFKCKWIPSELQKLSDEGLDVSRVYNPGYRCGAQEDATFNKTAIVMDFIAAGSDEQMAKKVESVTLPARMFFVENSSGNDRYFRVNCGIHCGKRVISRSPHFPISKNETFIAANGPGSFFSADRNSFVSYEGNFCFNRFDDDTGAAVLCTDEFRYFGYFKNGLMHGKGTLEVYAPELQSYLFYYEGEFQHGAIRQDVEHKTCSRSTSPSNLYQKSREEAIEMDRCRKAAESVASKQAASLPSKEEPPRKDLEEPGRVPLYLRY